MTGSVRVFAPVERIAEVDGVSLVLLTVEILDDRTAVRFYCPRNARTIALRADFERQLRAHGELRRRGEGSRRLFPEEPITNLFGSSVDVTDDAGTAFGAQSGQAGGSGTEWLMQWTFLGTPSPHAQHLTVSITPPGHSISSVQIPLDR